MIRRQSSLCATSCLLQLTAQAPLLIVNTQWRFCADRTHTNPLVGSQPKTGVSCAAASPSASLSPTGSSSLSGDCESLCRLVASYSHTPSHQDVVTIRSAFHHVVDHLHEYERNGDLQLSPSHVNRLIILLSVLAKASSYLQAERNAAFDSATRFLDKHNETAAFHSPYLTSASQDHLSMIVGYVIAELTSADEQSVALPDLYEVLHHCVQLYVGDVTSLSLACRVLVSRHSVKRMSSTDMIDTLHLVTLAYKRMKIPLPMMDNILSPVMKITDASPRQLLMVLSSLMRVKRMGQASDVAKVVSRRLAAHTDGFTNRDLVLGLRAVTVMETCSETFASALLKTCIERADTLSPEDLGDVCKNLKVMHKSKALGSLTRFTCGKEVRLLLPKLASRSSALLGQFSLRDARHVLDCLEVFQVRHATVFSQLTPFVSSG